MLRFWPAEGLTRAGWDVRAAGWDVRAAGWDVRAAGWDVHTAGWDVRAAGCQDSLDLAGNNGSRFFPMVTLSTMAAPR